MGKLQSKHAGRRRESPEGDSVAASTSLCRRLEDGGGGSRGRLAGHRGRLTCPDGVKDGYRYFDEDCSEVFQKRGEDSSPRPLDEEKPGAHSGPVNSSVKKRLNFNEMECDVSVAEDNRQEWTFTLYDFDNSGKVTREDIAGLMHTIYEVVDNSVNHSPNNSKTLRVKLSVTPDTSQRRRANTDVQGTWASAVGSPDGVGGPDKRNLRRHNSDQNPPANTRHHYCLDENIERRNHYLDLAGIENYTSRFEEDTPENTKQEPQSKATQPHSRSHSQGPESHGARGSHRPQTCDAGVGQPGDVAPPPGRQQSEALPVRVRTQQQQQQLLLIARSPRVHGKPAAAKSGKALRLQSQSVYAPVLASPSELQQQQQYGNKKHRQRSREAHARYGMVSGAVLPPPMASEGDAYGGAYDAAMSVMQRHEHHHFHEHHHHHHYHHYTET